MRHGNATPANRAIGESTLKIDSDTPKGRQKDCDAQWALKNNETQFKHKSHVKAGAKSKLITGGVPTCTTARISETSQMCKRRGNSGTVGGLKPVRFGLLSFRGD